MDLRGRLRRWAYARPRVLVVDAPGSQALRWAVESAVDERGWEFALSPADADVLVVLGEPDAALTEAVDVVWSQVPRPRSRVHIAEPTLIDEGLDAAVDRLTSAPAAHGEPPAPSAEDRLAVADGGPGDDPHAGHDMDMSGHAGHDMGGHGADHGASGDGDHDMRTDTEEGGCEDAGHDMGGHGMHHGGMVAGLPMAMTAQDRDGLDLDTLSVGLGPILPAWPTGLVLRAQLQGDVLTDVDLSWAVGAQPTDAHAPDPQRTALDQLARFLVVAGWATAARRARRVRAQLMSADPGAHAAAQGSARRLAEQIQRSRALAWSIRGLGRLSETGAGEHDVASRVHGWCHVAAHPTAAARVAPMGLSQLAAALEGAELAAARLIVASFALDRAGADREEATASV